MPPHQRLELGERAARTPGAPGRPRSGAPARRAAGAQAARPRPRAARSRRTRRTACRATVSAPRSSTALASSSRPSTSAVLPARHLTLRGRARRRRRRRRRGRSRAARVRTTSGPTGRGAAGRRGTAASLRRRRWLLAPQPVDEPVGAHLPTRREREQRQQPARQRAADVDGATVVTDFERAEHPDLHGVDGRKHSPVREGRNPHIPVAAALQRTGRAPLVLPGTCQRASPESCHATGRWPNSPTTTSQGARHEHHDSRHQERAFPVAGPRRSGPPPDRCSQGPPAHQPQGRLGCRRRAARRRRRSGRGRRLSNERRLAARDSDRGQVDERGGGRLDAPDSGPHRLPRPRGCAGRTRPRDQPAADRRHHGLVNPSAGPTSPTGHAHAINLPPTVVVVAQAPTDAIDLPVGHAHAINLP